MDFGQTFLGIELGSTNIKAVLLGPDFSTLSSGTYNWENQLVDGLWSYSLEAVHDGVVAAVADLRRDAEQRLGVAPTTFGGIGVSAMMHGYLAFNAAGELLVPFRTWRNTNTEVAATALTEALDFNMPLRWSGSHLYQAILDGEPHVAQVARLTTLAGYVHWMLTGEFVLGVGDASGMFPIDPTTGTYDRERLALFDALATTQGFTKPLATLLPRVLPAGAVGGHLTEAGARWLDPTGAIQPGAIVCPPEGDAGTGMVATNAVAPHTGNVSVGTSIFAMVVLAEALANMHPEIDIVTTPAGDEVAMVHCNNGASELGAWAALFGEFASALGASADANAVFAALLTAALQAAPDAGGVLSYNNLSGEPVTGLAEGRPMVIRTPDSQLNLANFSRSQLYSVFAALALGMRILADEGVTIDTLYAHGGLFKTEGVAGRMLAAAVNTPVALAQTAGAGGAWGIAVLAAYTAACAAGETRDLTDWLADKVFADAQVTVIEPVAADVAGFNEYLNAYTSGLEIQKTATAAI